MSREAMKLALEALEKLDRVMKRSPDTDKAITAIKQALEQPEPEPVAWVERDGELVWNNREAAIGRNLYTSPPKREPEQEPVAWAISFDGETPYKLWDGGDCALLDIEVKRHGGKTRKMPLYTSPPKREPPCKTGSQCITKCMECTEQEPVIDKSAAIRIATSLGWTPQRKPLTHPQIHELDWPDGVLFEDILQFVRAIEAAHGIKENT